MNNEKRYEYDAILYEQDDNGGAYVIFPWDIREEFGKGRVKVHALFDGIPYDGSIVNMGVKNPDGSVCYIIDVLKAIRNKLNKHDGDRKKTWFVVKDKFSMRYSRRLSKVYGTWYHKVCYAKRNQDYCDSIPFYRIQRISGGQSRILLETL